MDPFTRPWTITDDALEALDGALSTSDNEQGAVLVGPRGSRMVTSIVADPVAGGRARYGLSTEVSDRAARFLTQHPELEYKGACHSHPAALAYPSARDCATFRESLDQNPHLPDQLFPIFVDVAPEQLASHHQGAHVLGTSHGSVAFFSAASDGRSSRPVPVPVAVLPISHQSGSMSGSTGLMAGPVRALLGPDSLPWLAVDFHSAEGGPVTAWWPPGYPLTPLMVSTGRSPAPRPLPWMPGADPAAAFAAAVAAMPQSNPAASRAGLTARLAHHLPNRADWHVTVLGAGSVGSIMAEALVRSGVRRITVVDPDDVEAANLSRTVYDSADIGLPKAEALVARLALIAPDLDGRPIPEAVPEDRDRLEELVGGTDLLVAATDDAAAELAVSAVAYPMGIPMVSVKLFARAAAGKIILIDPRRATPCLRCVTSGAVNPGDRQVDYGSGRLVAELALGPDIWQVSLRGVRVALALLSSHAGGGPLADWIEPLVTTRRVLHVTAIEADWSLFAQLAQPPMDGPYPSLWVAAGSDPDCPVCGGGTVDEPVPAAELGEAGLSDVAPAEGWLPAPEPGWRLLLRRVGNRLPRRSRFSPGTEAGSRTRRWRRLGRRRGRVTT